MIAPCISSLGLPNKVQQTRTPQTTEMYYLTVLEAIRLKSRCQQRLDASLGSREETFLASS